MTTRDFDVVFWGATGFTGSLAAEYMAKTYGARRAKVRWAIAGRSRDKLEALRKELVGIDPECADLPMIIADSHDLESLRALTSSTRVVCSTVGPFAKYGSELVAACVAEGTHYCDITGEVQWVRRMIDAHHEDAKRRGARIVHTCGYDSIPSDLGVFVLEEHARSAHGEPVRDVKSRVLGRSPAFSGGTMASMINAFSEATHDPSVNEIMDDPFALCPDPNEPTGPRKEKHGPGYDRELGGFVVPFIMAIPNTRVVHRSNALLGYPYGRDFFYRESMSLGAGPSAAVGASVMTAGTAVFQRAMGIGPLREWVASKLPQPGEGPSPQQRQGSYFALQFFGRVNGSRVRARFASNGDPGYGETAKMVSESALCLALDADKLPSQGGVLTPASAMGNQLVGRLRTAGMAIDAWSESATR